jgi:NADH:ubiquinone oxidoreductase subunit 5 (subunit L)/multisubunit Na+/H+ antiporter MnhA subunit
MEGPTPVSSLLHAATMVTAGVFLILRSSIIFEYSEIVLNFLVLIGGFTALFAGIIPISSYDLKKIIAYSTCSQLGYMFFICGLSNYSLAFFHL